MKLYELIGKNNNVFLIPIKEITLLSYTPSNENSIDEILEIHLSNKKTLIIKGKVLENYYDLRKMLGKLK